eukprot:3165731-Prymnesium_polylepis.1
MRRHARPVNLSRVEVYITTISLICMYACSRSHSSVQKVARAWIAASIGDSMRPVGVRHCSLVMSREIFVLTIAPSPSHGPLPWPGQPNSTQIAFIKST